ncbi:MAG: DNA primase [Bacteroidetes bacterium]|nr:DNA primase [Bacteroidota bacterium]MCH8523761.1 DNA primase [Balneolales bacterium]
MIPDHIKEEVKAAADIVEVVSDYVKLRRTGSNFQGLCPFHNEKSPSFNVSPSLGIYKCFGCGESGDVFSFVMKQDGISFTEAIRTIGARFGVDVPEESRPENDERFREKEGVYHALAFAGKFFYRQLVDLPEALEARKYLDKRGFTGATIRKYGVGYAPLAYDGLIKASQKAAVNERYLEQAGLIKYGRNGESAYDVFRGRIMFPIFNASGKVIAFGGRVLDGAAQSDGRKAPKYINSPQTLVYNKSEVLYGIHVAKNEIRKNSEVILVEGYTDVLSMHQSGILNAVATSGTAITAEQLAIMHRYGETLLMIYDSDLAGQNAMSRAIDLALREGLDVRLLQLPDGEDPDSFVRKFGKDSFVKYKEEHASDFVAFLIEKTRLAGKWDDPFHRTATITTILRSVAEIPDEIAQQAYVQRLSSLTGMGDRALFEQLGVQRAEIARSREKTRQRERRIGQPNVNRPVPAQTADHNRKVSSNHTPAGSLDPDLQDRFGPPPTEDPRFDNRPHNEAPPEWITGMPESAGDQRTFDAQPWPGERTSDPSVTNPAETRSSQRKPGYERELLRLMLQHGHPMVEYIGSQCNEDHFEDDEYRMLFSDIIQRYENGKPISVSVYTAMADPFPSLVGEVVIDRYTPSARTQEKLALSRKKDVYKIAKGELRSLKLHYLDRLKQAFQQEYTNANELEEKRNFQQLLMEVSRERVRYEQGMLDQLFPNPEDI